MQKHKLIIILILFCFCLTGYSQRIEMPISTEVPKRGIYKTFEEFKFNVPSVTDSFYLDNKIRTQKNWEGTISYTPRYASNNKKAKKIWGFSDGQKVYTFHQWEFFQVKLDTSSVGFYAYEELDNSGAVAAGLIGGAIGGGIYAAVAIDNAKKKKVYYTLNSLNGKLNSINEIGDSLNVDSQFTKLILYRRDKKEKKDPLNISLNDSIKFQLIPNSLKEFDIPISREPLKICYGNKLDQCIDLTVISNEIKYLEGSISSKTDMINLEEVKIEVGEFYSKQTKYFQDKRGK
jgi:hypothetical protein